ncbi:MAG: hypothetical protein BWY69_00750 [Planctomycetes bacterium ADurb.Bin401]|nr:MAG: hypothetical protein BWY69_00750 [Planctomycetes bacterium ADurb.Bin401]
MVVIDGNSAQAYDMIGQNMPVFLKDNRLFYTAKSGYQWQAVVDHSPGPRFENIKYDSLKLSPDDSHFGFAGWVNNKWAIVIDNKVQSESDDFTGQIFFSPDNSHTAYIIKRKGKDIVVKDASPQEEYDEIKPALVFSPDSEHLLYIGKKNSMWHVVLDGKQQNPYDDIMPESLRFSADSRHTIYMAKKYNSQILVVDGSESPAYDVIVSYPTVSDSGFEILTARGNTLYRTIWKP